MIPINNFSKAFHRYISLNYQIDQIFIDLRFLIVLMKDFVAVVPLLMIKELILTKNIFMF